MTSHTISSLPRISAQQLSTLLLQNPSPPPTSSSSSSSKTADTAIALEKLAIIDVRDDDHIGGHIKHSTHVPSATLDHKVPELVRKLQNKEVVVFHCALSQQRGPAAALRYLRERERLLGLGGSETAVGKALKKSAGEGKDEVKKGENERGWEDVGEGVEGEGEGSKEKSEQVVYLLDRGFVGWQEKFGEDVRLTEGYRKELWQEDY